MRKIAVIDYGAGNLRNVCAALDHLGARPVLVTGPEALTGCDGVVFPGVGVFGQAVEALQERHLWEPLRSAAQNYPFLGICLGMQLLYESSEESPGARGLELLSGQVLKLPANPPDARVPSIGWRRLEPLSDSVPVATGQMMYFVHSYHVPADAEGVVAIYHHGGHPVGAMVRRESVTGCQFHPEKSGAPGLELMAQLLELK